MGLVRWLMLVWLAASPAVFGQAAGRVPTVGVIGEQNANEPRLEAFRRGMRELGYTDGGNIRIEYRFLNGSVARVPDFVADLVQRKVDVLVVGGTVAAQEARKQTSTIPIVFTVAGDPVASGLVASLARPGGNATGLSVVATELGGKQLELLKAAVPRAVRFSLLYNPVNPTAELAVDGVREAARAKALELQVLQVREPADLPKAFAAASAWKSEAMVAISDPLLGSELAQISRLASANRLPALYNRREFPELGGLIAYGPSFSLNYRRAATYVDRLLKGAKPAELPVEQPTKFELVINLKTARALGLAIPQSLLLRADEVIQ